MSAERRDRAAERTETDASAADVAASGRVPRTAVFVLGPLRLTGRSAQAASIVVAVAIVALVFHYRARILATPLTISALLWIAFNVYWSAAATSSAPTLRSETKRSRAVHQYLMLLAYLLLFAPLPWLDRRVLPTGVIWVVVGLALQAGFFGLAIAARRTLGRNWSGADHREDRPRAHPLRAVPPRAAPDLYRDPRHVPRHGARVGGRARVSRHGRNGRGIRAEDSPRGAQPRGGLWPSLRRLPSHDARADSLGALKRADMTRQYPPSLQQQSRSSLLGSYGRPPKWYQSGRPKRARKRHASVMNDARVTLTTHEPHESRLKKTVTELPPEPKTHPGHKTQVEGQ